MAGPAGATSSRWYKPMPGFHPHQPAFKHRWGAKLLGATMWFWIFYRAKQDGAVLLVSTFIPHRIWGIVAIGCSDGHEKKQDRSGWERSRVQMRMGSSRCRDRARTGRDRTRHTATEVAGRSLPALASSSMERPRHVGKD